MTHTNTRMDTKCRIRTSKFPSKIFLYRRPCFRRLPTTGAAVVVPTITSASGREPTSTANGTRSGTGRFSSSSNMIDNWNGSGRRSVRSSYATASPWNSKRRRHSGLRRSVVRGVTLALVPQGRLLVRAGAEMHLSQRRAKCTIMIVPRRGPTPHMCRTCSASSATRASKMTSVV